MVDEELMKTWGRGRTRLSRAKNAGEYIPTWTQGQEQYAPGNLRNLMAEGYGKSSLLFSCIAEKATSFAPLRIQVERRDGKVVEGHNLGRLLNDPNPGQDGQDFQELLMTQYEVAGNAFVEMLPVATTPARREKFRGVAVQELNLIRPDYVQIRPGATYMQDVFLVVIEGQVRKRIPRSNMIHIHEPLVNNDFYGESKIVRLVRELHVDLKMSDFELAFFNNAGVPMGLLGVKGFTSEDEVTEIKSKFRGAYNGLRKWFDLLVLNSDEATYTQLGMKQSDMEMEGTRFHVESRICSVFGIPGVIVGARFAMANGPQPVEEAEHQFWAETMVPASLRFARAFEKHLLPKLAVQADRDAKCTYDFSVVRALQEDRSRKLREVVRLVLTGGFTVNQALSLVGMATIDGGDFYMRNGNQVVVTVSGEITPMAPGSTGSNPDNPLEGAAALQLEQVLRRQGI